jgi:UDP-GlcNAc3NAcA epimerase
VQDKLLVIDPVGFYEMIQLESAASVILTDSGGVQKEAFFFQVPCITLRGETEWVELIDGGYNCLAALHAAGIEKQVLAALQRGYDWNVNLYGDGSASEKIVSILESV